MTNRQWMMWKLIDMTDEEFAKTGHCECIYYKHDSDGDYCPDDCQHKCDEGNVKWLQQEHEDGD